ncbi:hypothetical protein M433DRAFT_9097 [Acidomyces richmondensis BFW]|nr:hypothetical protein M433DRAFT_9097 [Acidomyces richmondensis BFW]
MDYNLQPTKEKKPGRPVRTISIRKAGTNLGQNKLSFPQSQNPYSLQKGQDTEVEEDETSQEIRLQHQTNNGQ